ncbi:TonB-dependent hemoglobin/transferrin/lactoferrin family receptor [Phreatobacter aquaticus]|nr:TonB-dependent hemoglobin/transferrin/lactoferrin family receptor [Phreatobacter aquaticus]
MASVSLLVLAATMAGAHAQTPPPVATPTATGVASAVDEITVSAERTPSTIYNSTGTVTVITDREIDRQQIQGPRDIPRTEPGISVSNSPTRAGAGNFYIRGIGDNRVRLEVDGVRVPDYPGSNAGAGLYTRDFLDYDSLKRVEIIRGPASALYGSDAIGGVVSFVTKDPGDYLREVGRDWYAGTKLSYSGIDNSFSETFTGAARKGAFEFLFQYTRRDGHEVGINARGRSPNPQNYQQNNILSKLVYETPDSGRWRLTTELLWRATNTNMRTDLSSAVGSSTANDTNHRFRVSLDWTQQLAWRIADEVKTMVYFTNLDRQEHQDQLRTSTNRIRRSDFDFRQTIFGGDVQFSARRQFAGLEHHFVYGASADFTQTSRPRYRAEYNATTGAFITSTVAGDTFPNKNFPDTATTQAAAYLQDTISWGAFRFIPAIRFDYYHLSPRPDAAFYSSNSAGYTIGDKTSFAVSPKFGLTYDLTENFRVFGQYSRGFRAPPYDNANFAYTNTAQFYEILPNFNLRPETSDGFEAGLRGRFSNGSSFQLAGFYNLYHDFINTVTVGTSVGGLTQFQYQNLSSVKIWGFEARGEWRVTPEWSVLGAMAYARGTDQTTGAALDTVDPLTGTASIRYTDPNGWMVEGRARGALSKTLVSSSTVFKPGAYATFDILGSYEINKNITVRAQVLNIFNASYFNAVDVMGLAANNANLELFRAPGRSASVSLSAKF